MKHQQFAIFDAKAAAYLPPFIIHRNDMAVRLFADSINDPNHQFGKNPADYTLFNIGEFDDNKGEVFARTKISLGNGIEFVVREHDETKQPMFTDPEIGNIHKIDLTHPTNSEKN